MRNIRAAMLIVLFLAFAVPTSSVEGQTQPPWPDGCSVRLPLFIQNGLDLLFLGACDKHDRCWAQCNGQFPPYLGLGHKTNCDLRFLLDMEAACAAWSVVLAYPGSGWGDVDDFLEDCSVVAGTFATAVSVMPFAVDIFWRSQCRRGCNPDGCTLAPEPWNSACGRGQCYYYATLPSPSDPPQPDDPCFDPDSELQAAMVEGDRQVTRLFPRTNYPLLRQERRDGFRYRMEEWALIEIEIGDRGRIERVESLDASSPTFGRFQRYAFLKTNSGEISGGKAKPHPPEPGRSTVLVVSAPPHRHDERWIPTPRASLAELDSETDFATGRVVIRADFGEDRSLIALDVIHSDRPLLADEVMYLQENLRLQYNSDRTHRAVLFAVLDLGSRPRIDEELTVLPRCCPNQPGEF